MNTAVLKSRFFTLVNDENVLFDGPTVDHCQIAFQLIELVREIGSEAGPSFTGLLAWSFQDSCQHHDGLNRRIPDGNSLREWLEGGHFVTMEVAGALLCNTWDALAAADKPLISGESQEDFEIKADALMDEAASLEGDN